jgi:hypothetical protein
LALFSAIPNGCFHGCDALKTSEMIEPWFDTIRTYEMIHPCYLSLQASRHRLIGVDGDLVMIVVVEKQFILLFPVNKISIYCYS